MNKAKFQPLLLVASFLASVSMTLRAYENFTGNETGYGVFFAVIALFFLGLTIFGLITNRKAARRK